MSVPNINTLRDNLLIELAKRKATNGNPQSVMDICRNLQSDVDWKANSDLARSAGWLLVKNDPPLAKTVLNSDNPGALLLAMTAAGKSEASRLFESNQPLTFVQKLGKVTRTEWVAISALFVSIVSASAAIASAYFTFKSLGN